VIRGAAGIGKTTLTDYARKQADGMTVLAATGVESQAEIAFSGAHQLLRSLVPGVKRLPAAQATAVSVALGIVPARSHDRFLVGVGALGLLSSAASERPILCVVDDAHWIDRESIDAFLFVARRLEAESVVFLFATRETYEFADDLPALWVGPLSASEARALVDERHPQLDTMARERVVEVASGNPLALVELPGRYSDDGRGGSVTAVERAFQTAIQALSPAAQLLLLTAAAAEPSSVKWVIRAAESMDCDPHALADVERSGLVSVEIDTIVFRHPLVRTAVYTNATFLDRQRVHRTLALVLDEDEADRRAWHRAAATDGPDDDVAEELEYAANRSRRRSGEAAASAALERAAALSRSDAARARRLTAAAEAAWRAGDVARSERLLEQLASGEPDADLRATTAHLRGLIRAQAGHPREAASLLAEAAHAVASETPERGLRLAAVAAETSWFGGDAERLAELSSFIRATDPTSLPEEAFIRHYVDGLAEAFRPDPEPALRSLNAAANAPSVVDGRMLIWAGDAAALLGDGLRAYDLHVRGVAQSREKPAVGDLVHGLYSLARSELALGRLSEAAADAAEGHQLAVELDEPGSAAHLAALLAHIASVRGDAEACRVLAGQALEGAVPRNLPLAIGQATLALAELELADGDPSGALARLEELATPQAHPAFRSVVAPLLAEAAVRAGEPRRAQRPLASATPWVASGAARTLAPQLLRAKALLAKPENAEELFLESLISHTDSLVPLDRARTQLCYGEYLRRVRRRTDARVVLRAAVETFAACGATQWAARAAAELRATGETARSRNPSTLSDLTPQELQVARLVAQGISNREVAARLFLSPKTVEFHLHKVFQKFGIASRRELAGIFNEASPPATSLIE
jgi:DNA-binding CsgD family transcriptional regulator